MIESMRGSDRVLPIAEEALAVARRQGGTVIRLQPLKAVMGAASQRRSGARARSGRGIRAHRPHEATGRTRASAGTWSRSIRVKRGEVAEGLTEWREVLRSYDNNGQRTDLALSLIGLAGSLAGVDRLVAVEIGAIVESDAIAPLAAFATPDLAPLVEEFAAEIDAARARAATLSYDDALAFVFDAIERLIAEHGTPGPSPG